MKHFSTMTAAVIIACILIAGIPVSADDSGSTLTRGGASQSSSPALPNTSYYFWLTNTFTMSGEPGDQPPVVMANQANIRQDPEGGPYTIGSYAYSNGGGRTILDDVAPSTASMSNTNYYGLATTDSSGRAVVTFITSAATATESFSVKAENPKSAAGVGVYLHEKVFSRTTPPTPVIITPTTTPTTPSPPSLTPAISVDNHSTNNTSTHTPDDDSYGSP